MQISDDPVAGDESVVMVSDTSRYNRTPGHGTPGRTARPQNRPSVDDPEPNNERVEDPWSIVVFADESATTLVPTDPGEFDCEFDPDADSEFDAGAEPDSEADGEWDWDGEHAVCDAESAADGGVSQPAVAPRPATAADAPARPLMKVRRFVVELPGGPAPSGCSLDALAPVSLVRSAIGIRADRS